MAMSCLSMTSCSIFRLRSLFPTEVHKIDNIMDSTPCMLLWMSNLGFSTLTPYRGALHRYIGYEIKSFYTLYSALGV